MTYKVQQEKESWLWSSAGGLASSSIAEYFERSRSLDAGSSIQKRNSRPLNTEPDIQVDLSLKFED